MLTQASREREELDGLGVGGSRWTRREEQQQAIQNRRGLNMALGSGAVQSTGRGVPVLLTPTPEASTALSLPASPWNTLSISAAPSLLRAPF